jgi:hypothetical protein
MKRTMAALAAGVGMLALAGTANAATLGCSIGAGSDSVSYTLGSATQVECVSGNDSGTFFGISGFLLGDKEPGNTGDQNVFFTDVPTAGETSPGTWAISIAPGTIANSIVVVLKQSNSYAAFLVDSLSGNWTTAGPSNSLMDLSHASVWYSSTVIPLPPAALLFGTALAGVGFMSRRKKAANAA